MELCVTRVQLKPEYCSVHQNMVRGDGWGLENNTIPACSWCAEHQGMVHHRWMMFHIMVHNAIVDQHGVAWYDAVCILHHTMPHCVHNVWYYTQYTCMVHTVWCTPPPPNQSLVFAKQSVHTLDASSNCLLVQCSQMTKGIKNPDYNLHQQLLRNTICSAWVTHIRMFNNLFIFQCSPVFTQPSSV